MECEHGDFKSTVKDDLVAKAKSVVGRPATPVGYAGVARCSSVGAGAPGVGVTPRVGVGEPGVGLAPGSLGGPVNRVGVRQMGGDVPLTAVVSANSQESLIMSMKQKLKDELKAVGIAALYFGCWIAALLLIKSLVLAEYRIAFHHWSMAVIGALVLSKVVLVLEHVSLGAWVRSHPTWVDVVLRTALYAFGVAVVLILEKGWESRHEFGGFGPAVGQLFQQADVHHVWANTICLTGALLGYNLLSVVRRHLGKGGLIRIFLSPLPNESESNRAKPSSIAHNGGKE